MWTVPPRPRFAAGGQREVIGRSVKIGMPQRTVPAAAVLMALLVVLGVPTAAANEVQTAASSLTRTVCFITNWAQVRTRRGGQSVRTRMCRFRACGGLSKTLHACMRDEVIGSRVRRALGGARR
jgi:hypothetical protein